jgi:hypothetical protein
MNRFPQSIPPSFIALPKMDYEHQQINNRMKIYSCLEVNEQRIIEHFIPLHKMMEVWKNYGLN